jgi:tetratricopeptide (TPR) repeat protein
MEAWQLAFDAGRHAAALPLIEALAAAYPQEPSLHYRHAQTLRELGHFEAALGALGRLLELRPHTVPALLQRAELEHLLGDASACEDSLRRAVAIDPRHAEARVRLAAFLLDRGESRYAGYELDQALALDPASDAAAALRQRMQAAAIAPPVRGSGPDEAGTSALWSAKIVAAVKDAPAPMAGSEPGPKPVRLLIDALPVAPISAAKVAAAAPLPELPAAALQALLDSHWARLRQDEDRLAATASFAALLLAWEPPPSVVPATNPGVGAHAEGLRALGYRPLATLRPSVHLPFAEPVQVGLFMSGDGRVLALQSVLPLPRVSVLERCWLRLTGRWQHIDLLEFCSQLGEGDARMALILSNNLGGQVPFQDLPPVYAQRYSPRASPKALDVLHRERIEKLRRDVSGRCLPLGDLAAAEALLHEVHQRRRQGRQQLDLLRDEELQRFLGTHYTRVAGRVYRQLEALQQGVQDLLAAQASRASEPA